MTEYELVDATATYSSNFALIFTLYLTLVSGYLVTAFVAGTRLSSVQVSILNFGFIISASLMAFSALGAGIIRVHYTRELLELAADAPHRPLEWLFLSWFILMVVGVLASLYFVWDVRHPKSD